MRILAINPFHNGSHRDFAEGIERHSRHTWHWITGAGLHWKWRMRSFPLVAAAEIECLENPKSYDCVFCTDMLDLPALMGLIRRSPVAAAPVAIYFHENQWAYPVRAEANPDHHYAYTNVLSAVNADRVIFNSNHNRRTFFEGAQLFLNRMPDSVGEHDLKNVEAKSLVISPGFEPRAAPAVSRAKTSHHPITIGWVSRWEHDKRPDRLCDLLIDLETSGLPFQLVLLGPRPRRMPDAHRTIAKRFQDSILFDGFAESRSEYQDWISQMDIVVSTADHEFFGVAMCEAIDAGAVPIVPRGLSYDEYVPAEFRYATTEQARQMIHRLCDSQWRAEQSDRCREHIRDYQRSSEVSRLDDILDCLSPPR